MSSPINQTPDTRLIDSSGSGLRDIRGSIHELIQYRYLLQNLVKRDLKVRYRNSVLGVLWSLLNPLLMMLVFSLIFAKLIPEYSRPPYVSWETCL